MIKIGALKEKVIRDLKEINMPIDEVELSFRPFSKTYYGRYFPLNSKVFVYPYKNRSGELFPYDVILDTTIHEMVHHIQHTNPSFERKKGVMHDPHFWGLYNLYKNRAEKLLEERGEISEKKSQC